MAPPCSESLHKALPEAFYDVHLMITDPVTLCTGYRGRQGANLITFHHGGCARRMSPETIAAVRADRLPGGPHHQARPTPPQAVSTPTSTTWTSSWSWAWSPATGGQEVHALGDRISRAAALQCQSMQPPRRLHTAVGGGRRHEHRDRPPSAPPAGAECAGHRQRPLQGARIRAAVMDALPRFGHCNPKENPSPMPKQPTIEITKSVEL